MKEPVRSRNAVELPKGIAPRARQRTPVIVSISTGAVCCRGRGRLTDEHSCGNRAAELLIDLAEESRERNGIIAGEGPVDARVCQSSADAA